MTLRLRGAAVCVAALVVVAGLVQWGVTRGIDRFSLEQLRPLSGGGWQLLATPADAYVAGALVLVLAALIWRRDGWRAAWPWPAALLVSLLVEVAGKQWISQIRYADAERIGSVLALNGSFPSGHVCRALILAAAVVWLWPALRWAAAAFGVYMVVVVVVTGMHVPTDVAGGLLLGGALVLVAREVAARGRRPRPQPPAGGSGVQASERARSMSSA